MAKLLGIDYGARRVGIAMTDASGSVAFPKGTLPNDKSLVSSVSQMITDHSVTDVVIGESRDKDGKENDIMKRAKLFGTELGATGVTVHYEPEYYSSQEARIQTGEYVVDAQAAAIILNSYITKHGNNH